LLPLRKDAPGATLYHALLAIDNEEILLMSTKNYYICTAIPYVNDKPHIGHAMDFVYADILARYNRQLGYNVLFGTGTSSLGGP
jgi:leucyl-tRNA synthetase